MDHFYEPFLSIDFSFATLKALGKTPWEIDNFQGEETRMLVQFFINLPESLSSPATLELLISCMTFKTCFSVVPTRDKSAVIPKLLI